MKLPFKFCSSNWYFEYKYNRKDQDIRICAAAALSCHATAPVVVAFISLLHF